MDAPSRRHDLANCADTQRYKYEVHSYSVLGKLDFDVYLSQCISLPPSLCVSWAHHL